MSTYRCQNCGHEFDAGLLFCGKCGAPNQTAQRIHQIEQMLQGEPAPPPGPPKPASANILSGTMDAFASVISNNLNIVMKVLASVTIVISIPNIIAGFYGMNVEGLPLSQFFWFPILLSGIIMAVVAFILHKRDMM